MWAESEDRAERKAALDLDTANCRAIKTVDARFKALQRFDA